MSHLVYDHTQLVEPNLLIPGKKPIGPVRIDWSHPLTAGLRHAFAFTAASRFRDLVTGITPSVITNATLISKGVDFNDGHLEYPCPDWINSGVTNTTFACRMLTDGISGSDRSGFGFALEGVTKRTGILHYASQIWYETFSGVNNIAIKDTDALTADIFTDLAMSYDGTRSTAADRLRGFTNGILQTGTGTFPTSLNTDFDLLMVGAYESSGAHNDGYTTYEYGYIWERTLTDTELESVRRNPYQFLIPVG